MCVCSPISIAFLCSLQLYKPYRHAEQLLSLVSVSLYVAIMLFEQLSLLFHFHFWVKSYFRFHFNASALLSTYIQSFILFFVECCWIFYLVFNFSRYLNWKFNIWVLNKKKIIIIINFNGVAPIYLNYITFRNNLRC